MVGGNYSVVGVMPSHFGLDVRARAHAEMLQYWRDGALQVPVWRVFGFEQANDAVEELASGRAQGKIAVRIP